MSTSMKRKRDDEDDGQEERDISRHPFCPDCGRNSHDGNCLQRCVSCDRYHEGNCTAFCRKCTGIGHSWQHCHLFVPSRNPRRNRNRRRQNTAPNMYVGQVHITVPVVNTAPVTTPAALNEDILGQLKVALADLQYQGVSVPARVTMTNVNITTNLITRGAAATQPMPKDTSLLERVQKIPTRPRSDAPAFKPRMSQQSPAQSYSSQYGFAQSAFSQPAFGRHAFGEPSFGPSPFSFEPPAGFRPISTWPPMGNDFK